MAFALQTHLLFGGKRPKTVKTKPSKPDKSDGYTIPDQVKHQLALLPEPDKSTFQLLETLPRFVSTDNYPKMARDYRAMQAQIEQTHRKKARSQLKGQPAFLALGQQVADVEIPRLHASVKDLILPIERKLTGMLNVGQQAAVLGFNQWATGQMPLQTVDWWRNVLLGLQRQGFNPEVKLDAAVNGHVHTTYFGLRPTGVKAIQALITVFTDPEVNIRHSKKGCTSNVYFAVLYPRPPWGLGSPCFSVIRLSVLAKEIINY